MKKFSVMLSFLLLSSAFVIGTVSADDIDEDCFDFEEEEECQEVEGCAWDEDLCVYEDLVLDDLDESGE